MIQTIIGTILIIIIIISAALLGKSFIKLSLKDMVVLALFVAFSVGGRYIFSFIPSVQPSSFIIITAGMLYGPAGGFFAGVATGLLSNLFLGMGPYVIGQMFCWGMMGLFSGYLKSWNRFYTATYGFVWGFVFGWIMNFWMMIYTGMPITIEAYLLLAVSSFTMDLAHALSNAVLLIFFPYKFTKKLSSLK